jgi:hypothetical protein
MRPYRPIRQLDTTFSFNETRKLYLKSYILKVANTFLEDPGALVREDFSPIRWI